MEASRWAKTLALDRRSLRVFRVALALLVLADLGWRALDLTAHYTDTGVLPRSAVHAQAWDFGPSLHMAFGSPAWEAALFALAGAAALALLFGVRTRWALVVVWAITVSLHARNPLLRDGQDDLLRILLFFSIFLPLEPPPGSADAPSPVVSVGTLAYVAQLCLLYEASALAKLRSPWWQGGHGVQYALSLMRYQTGLGQLLLQAPGLLRLSNFGVMGIEALLPLALFWPGRGRLGRWIAVLGFMALHLAFGLGMRLGSFPYVGVAAWLPLLPDRFPGGTAPAVDVRAPSRVDVLPVAGWVLGLLFNLTYLEPRWPTVPGVVRACELLGLQQYWALFSPDHVTPELMRDGYFVVSAVLRSGREVDLRTGAPVDETPPARVTFPNTRWRHYFANIAWDWPRGSQQEDTVVRSRRAYLRWACAGWNAQHSGVEGASSARLVFLRHRLDVPDSRFERTVLSAQGCSD